MSHEESLNTHAGTISEIEDIRGLEPPAARHVGGRQGSHSLNGGAVTSP